MVKYLFQDSNKVVINLLNGIFNENFKEDEIDISIGNNEFIKHSSKNCKDTPTSTSGGGIARSFS